MRRWRVGDAEDAANGLWTVIRAETPQEAASEWYRLYDLCPDDPDVRLIVSEWREPSSALS